MKIQKILFLIFNFSLFGLQNNGWKAVGFRIYLAPKNHGYSVSPQNYDFCPRLRKPDILDFTLSHMDIILCHSAIMDISCLLHPKPVMLWPRSRVNWKSANLPKQTNKLFWKLNLSIVQPKISK